MSASDLRPLTSVVSLEMVQRSPGFLEGTLFHGHGPVIDPFLAFTDFHMSEPTFGPHPHAGFSAVTYMFRDSQGSFVNRDSLGDRSIIGPGALHWTQAGAGMMHEEVPVDAHADCHGLQLFVNLAAADKDLPGRAFHLDAEHVPVVEPGPGVRVHVVAGAFEGVRSPLRDLATSITLLDVDLHADATVTVEVDPAHRAVVLVVAGTVSAAGRTLGPHTIGTAEGPASRLAITAVAGDATVLVLAGRPFDEPVVVGGSFVMNDRDAIDRADARFRAGEMGRLEPSF